MKKKKEMLCCTALFGESFEEWKKDLESDGYFEDMAYANGGEPEDYATFDKYLRDYDMDVEDTTMQLGSQTVDGVIVAFARVGRWNGTFNGYKKLSNQVSDIMDFNYDDAEWYSDGKDIRATLAHHDGQHTVLYRVCKDEELADKVCNLWYNGANETDIKRRTKSIRPYIASIYGWSK